MKVANTRSKTKAAETLKAVETGYLHSSVCQKATKQRLDDYQAMCRMMGQQEALAFFSAKYKAPFGRDRAVRYEVNTETGAVKMAGVVWRPETPNQQVEKPVLAQMVNVRFENPKEVITFTLDVVPTTLNDLHHAINVATFKFGMTSKSKRYREYISAQKKAAAVAAVAAAQKKTKKSRTGRRKRVNKK